MRSIRLVFAAATLAALAACASPTATPEQRDPLGGPRFDSEGGGYLGGGTMVYDGGSPAAADTIAPPTLKPAK